MAPSLISKLSVKQTLTEAKEVATRFCIPEVVDARMAPEQGMFSRTAIVTLGDAMEVVVQLKDNEIDTTKVALANSILGDVVPLVRGAPTTRAHFAYVAPYVPGTIWSEAEASAEQDVYVAAQIGRLIGACCLGLSSTGIVSRYVVPRLEHILAKENIEDENIRGEIQAMIQYADRLKKLPLSLCHWDINKRNVIFNDQADVMGLVDWEQANLLPFAMNAWCIRFLSVPTIGGRDRPSENAGPMARAFWDTLLSSLPEGHRSLDKKAIISSMEVGYVLQAFWEGGAPEARKLVPFLERLAWFKETFEPLCNA